MLVTRVAQQQSYLSEVFKRFLLTNCNRFLFSRNNLLPANQWLKMRQQISTYSQFSMLVKMAEKSSANLTLPSF